MSRHAGNVGDTTKSGGYRSAIHEAGSACWEVGADDGSVERYGVRRAAVVATGTAASTVSGLGGRCAWITLQDDSTVTAGADEPFVVIGRPSTNAGAERGGFGTEPVHGRSPEATRRRASTSITRIHR